MAFISGRFPKSVPDRGRQAEIAATLRKGEIEVKGVAVLAAAIEAGEVRESVMEDKVKPGVERE